MAPSPLPRDHDPRGSQDRIAERVATLVDLDDRPRGGVLDRLLGNRLVTFGVERLSGGVVRFDSHARQRGDHIGVHERTYTALRALGDQAPPLYYVTMKKGTMQRVAEAARAKGGAPSDSSFWGIAPDAFGDEAEAPTLAVDVRDWAPRKLAALRCHRTQMGRNNPIAWINDDEARHYLGIEYFRRAPIGRTDRGLLEQLGDRYAARNA